MLYLSILEQMITGIFRNISIGKDHPLKKYLYQQNTAIGSQDSTLTNMSQCLEKMKM